MLPKNRKIIVLVYADWGSMKSTQLMGTLHAELLRGKEIFSFEYNPSWLETNQAQLLDPDLRLYREKQ